MTSEDMNHETMKSDPYCNYDISQNDSCMNTAAFNTFDIMH